MSVLETGSGVHRRLRGFDRRIERPKQLLKRIGKAFIVSTRVLGVLGSVIRQQRRIARQNAVGIGAVSYPKFVGGLAVPGDRLFGSRHFKPNTVLVPRSDLRDVHGSSRSTFQSKQECPIVFGINSDIDSIPLRCSKLARKRFRSTRRSGASREDGLQIGADGDDTLTGDRLDQVQPVGPDIGDGSKSTSLALEDSPIEVGRLMQPILNIASSDVKKVTQFPSPDLLSSLDAKRVEADIVVHTGFQAGFVGMFHEQGAFPRVHRQWLFAENMFSRLEGFDGLLEMESIRAGDMHHIDRGVLEQFLITGIRTEGRNGRRWIGFFQGRYPAPPVLSHLHVEAPRYGRAQ